MKKVTTIGFKEFGNGRYTHKRGIQMRDSWVSRMVRELQEFNTVTKSEFICRYRPHITRERVTRGGWGTSMWASLERCGLIQKTPYTRKNREHIWVRGPEFDTYEKMRNFFESRGNLDWAKIENLRHLPSAFDSDEDFEEFRDFFTRDTYRSRWVWED